MALDHSNNKEMKRPFFERFGAYIGLVSGVLSLITVFAGWFFWIDGRVQDLVAKKLAPYETLLMGDSFVRNKQYDDACGVYREAFRQFKELGDGDSIPTALIDQYLYAIANTEDPARYARDFDNIKKELGDVTNTGWQLHEMGWYYFRIRDLEKARTHFQEARERRAARHRQIEAAITYWSLALVALVDGDMDEAIRHYREAERRNPIVYAANRVVERRSTYKNAVFWARLRETYKDTKFGESLDKMIDRIEAEEQRKLNNAG